MNEKILLKGNEALAETAIRAGCRYYFGYPITPQNEVPAYMSWRLPEVNGIFLQAESELAAINMVFGAGACGVRVMTSSSSPGISLMQEGISYISGAETPCVLVNIMRGGPGLGNISPSQADYNQSVKGGGHGDYKLIVAAPSTIQELVDITYESFDYSIKYRIPYLILGDGILGQMSEPVVLPKMKKVNDKTDWAICNNNKQSIVKSLFLIPETSLEDHNHKLQEKYRKIEKEYVKFEEYMLDDAEYILVAYGTTSRVVRSAINTLRQNNIKAGLFRPITLWPFPNDALTQNLKGKKNIFVFEMAHNQLTEDVKLSVNGKVNVKGFYKLGGAIFNENNVCTSVMNAVR